MKAIYLLIAASLFACNDRSRDNRHAGTDINAPTSDSVSRKQADTAEAEDTAAAASRPPKTYSNARFKDVTVIRTGDHLYTVRGKGQIFEANFGWVVEDGHEELQQGHQMTDAGAPEWGAFSFTVKAEKKRPNSTLTLILFETSARDGSRQHQLPITLE